MDRLELAQRVKRECSDSGSITSTTSITSASNQRIVDWTDQAWLEIQTKHRDWGWMRASAMLTGNAGGASPLSFTTVAGTARYALGAPAAGTVGITAATFGAWVGGAFRCYLTATGVTDEQEMQDRSYDYWRDVTFINANRNVRSRPYEISIAPDNSLCLGPVPAAGYTITGDYYIAPTAMAADGDEPTGLPLQYHMAIVYRAMVDYGSREGAPEVTQRGALGYDRLMRELEREWMPIITTCGPIA